MIRHPNLKHRFLFNNVADSIDSATPLTQAGTVTYPAGRVGGCASATFNALNNLNKTLPAVVGTNDVTVCIWFKAASTPTLNYTPSLLRIGTPNQIIFEIVKTTGVFRPFIYVWITSSYNYANSTVNVCDNAWHHLAFVRSGVNLKSYVDGVLKSSQDYTGTTDIQGGMMRIGWGGDATYDHLGAASPDDLQIYYTALTLSDIKRIMAGFHPLRRS